MSLAGTSAGPPELPLRPVLPAEIPTKDPTNRENKTERLQYVIRSGTGSSPGTTGGYLDRAEFLVQLPVQIPLNKNRQMEMIQYMSVRSTRTFTETTGVKMP